MAKWLEWVRYAIVDTGIDINHEAISSRISSTLAYGNPSASTDTDGHGTHVAGIVAGNGARSEQFNKMGFAPLAQLLNQAFIGCQNNCPSLYDLHSNAWSRGVRVSNNSWTYGTSITTNQYDAYARELDNFVYNTREDIFVNSGKRTFTIVQAAGNSGNLESPASAKNIITVGGSRNNITNSLDVDPGSGAGPTSDGRTKPDIVAPGYDVISLRSQNSNRPIFEGNEFYTQMGGGQVWQPLKYLQRQQLFVSTIKQ